MSNDLIIDKIQSMTPHYTKSEKIIANYILEVENSFTYSLSKFAKIVGVSEPTIIRFSRKLGLKGYSELKLKLSINESVENSNKNKESNIKLKKTDSPYDIFKSISEYTIKSIRSTRYNTLNKSDLESVVNLIMHTENSNKNIYLTGMGMSSIIAESFQVKLMRININAIYYPDIHLRFESCTNISKGDLLICFTTLGKSKDNYNFINLAKSKGAKVILITQFGSTKIAKLADLVLYTSTIENNLRLTAQASFIVQNLIIETIFLALALSDYDDLYQSIQESKNKFYEYEYYKK